MLIICFGRWTSAGIRYQSLNRSHYDDKTARSGENQRLSTDNYGPWPRLPAHVGYNWRRNHRCRRQWQLTRLQRGYLPRQHSRRRPHRYQRSQCHGYRLRSGTQQPCPLHLRRSLSHSSFFLYNLQSPPIIYKIIWDEEIDCANLF